MSSARSLSSARFAAEAAIAAVLALSCLAGIPRAVHAGQGGPRKHEFRRDEYRDARYYHDHYYPPRG